MSTWRSKRDWRSATRLRDRLLTWTAVGWEPRTIDKSNAAASGHVSVTSRPDIAKVLPSGRYALKTGGGR